MDLPVVDRGTLLAAFAGAVAYLCMKGKMPVLAAATYVTGGTLAAAYLAPGLIEYLETIKMLTLGDRAQAALTFLMGVGGIWVLNIFISVLQAANARSSDFVGRLLDRIFGTSRTPPPDPPPLDSKRGPIP